MSSSESHHVVWLSEIGRADVALVGGKAANVGELTQIGVPVPPGFVITAAAFAAHLRAHRLDRLITQTLTGLDPDAGPALEQRAGAIRERILAAPLDPPLIAAIHEAYQQLVGLPGGGSLVAVRSSSSADGLPDASIPEHQRATFLGVSGSEAILRAIREAWASLYTAHAVSYRLAHGLDHLGVSMAVLVQTMVNADVAGTLFTLDPLTGNKAVIRIDAAWGWGDAVVAGLLTPDHYLVDKVTLAVVERQISHQTWQVGRRAGTKRPVHLPVPPASAGAPKLSDTQITELARLGKQIEAHFQIPQDTEWALKDGRIFFLQARPVTIQTRTVPVRHSRDPKPEAPVASRPLLLGTGASAGWTNGPVRILHSPAELDQVRPGDVVVTELTSPEYTPALRQAAALITDTGGPTSHAAIVARELGLPTVIGTRQATHILHQGQTVTVDGTHGRVYRGKLRLDHPARTAAARRSHQPVHTHTKLMVNLSSPERAAEVAKLDVDGVGLLRAEFMIAAMGHHPKALLAAGKRPEYVRKLAAGLEQFARAFHPHPVIYRASDFKTNEYRGLAGGAEFEPAEENPMLGFRGALRYLADPDVFAAELEAVKVVRGQANFDNLWLMLPFVRTVGELRAVKTLVQASGLSAERRFKLFMMVEVPSNVLLIDDFLEEGIDGISIGSNDLTQLILGVDRDNQALAAHFDERDPAVLKAIELVLAAARQRHLPVSICGEAPSKYPELIEFLVRRGITSLSVNPGVVDQTRRLIASVERHLHRS